jgi:1-acyl-sn-glycerol-3-phosphate acyltransferase
MPAFLLALLCWVALLPVLLPLALAADLVFRRRLAGVRFVGAILLFFAFENFGVLSVVTLVVTGRATHDRLYALEGRWADSFLRAVLRLFSMKLEIQGLELLRPGPIMLVGNHVSVIDALLPAAFATARQGLRLRYVAKGELIWDPCVDLAGHLLPNVFVRRGSVDTPGDLARVQTLVERLGTDDGVVLFPEGTRFTQEKRDTLIARRDADGPREHLERDRKLQCLMPPRTGGLLALFARDPGTDVIIMAHTGLEGSVRIPDLWGGALIGRTLRVEFWRVPWSTIPAGREERVDWIYAQWERLDGWVARARAMEP